MDVIRKFIQFIFRHKVVSLLLLVAVVAGVRTARNWQLESEGDLTEPIKRGTIVDAVYGIGTVLASHSFFVRGGQVGHLDHLFVQEGFFVERGAPLVVIDGILTRAPFAGTITYCPYKQGELVFTQTIVLSLVDMTDRYLSVSLEQAGALRIRPRQAVHISFDSIRNERSQGTVRAVYSNGSDFLARIDSANLPLRILPGMTGDVAITVNEKKDVLLVPVAAIENSTVWKSRAHGRPVQVKVELGIVDRDMAEVVKGDLAPGDRLIIHKRKTT